jgi:lipoate-protein ligase A
LLEALLAPSKVTLATQFVRSRWRPVTTIAEALSEPVAVGDVKSRLITSVENLLEVRLETGRLSASEEDYSRKLFAEKYSSQNWNLNGNRQ